MTTIQATSEATSDNVFQHVAHRRRTAPRRGAARRVLAIWLRATSGAPNRWVLPNPHNQRDANLPNPLGRHIGHPSDWA